MSVNNTAKLTFLYLISLITLVLTTVSLGTVVFQIINKNVAVLGEPFSGIYNLSALRFALSSLIIAAPVYYFSVRAINKSLKKGEIMMSSAIRRWLTYLILLVSLLVVLGYLIGVIYSFFGGELTLKFILKALTVFFIAGAMGWYYFWDVKRAEVAEYKEKFIRIFGWIFVVVTVVAVLAGIIWVESPLETRRARQDNLVLNNLISIDNEISNFYSQEDRLPKDLKEAISYASYLGENNLVNSITGKEIGYVVEGKDSYELCTDFQTDDKESSKIMIDYYRSEEWRHAAGEYCFKRTIKKVIDKQAVPVPLRLR